MLKNNKCYRFNRWKVRYYHRSHALCNKATSKINIEKHGSINTPMSKKSSGMESKLINDKLMGNGDEKVKSSDLIKTLSEQLILETNLNLHKATTAQNQFSTLRIFYTLLLNGKFNSKQSDLITQLIIFLLNDNFFNNYNDKFLRDFEINKQKHLFNALTNEIKFDINNSRNLQFLQIRKKTIQLEKELNNVLIEISGLTNNKLNEESKLNLNQHIIDNRLLFKQLQLRLNELNNKITKQVAYDVKSDIENLRWHSTRMGLLAIMLMTFMVLTAINVINRRKRKSEDVTYPEFLADIDDNEVESFE